ncbi:hypothetical protein FB45DRAFT_876870 [Roridomyces roridus]|uniref:Uncharacterized protein n=1 Tax=Roridomyces roridus TaxID=1738132 RepID=A0AAD7F8P5_9AGAR|nr:hypothetical protein FB45DRAFT_876870 [Roridomyces roridus]
MAPIASASLLSLVVVVPCPLSRTSLPYMPISDRITYLLSQALESMQTGKIWPLANLIGSELLADTSKSRNGDADTSNCEPGSVHVIYCRGSLITSGEIPPNRSVFDLLDDDNNNSLDSDPVFAEQEQQIFGTHTRIQLATRSKFTGRIQHFGPNLSTLAPTRLTGRAWKPHSTLKQFHKTNFKHFQKLRDLESREGGTPRWKDSVLKREVAEGKGNTPREHKTRCGVLHLHPGTRNKINDRLIHDVNNPTQSYPTITSTKARAFWRSSFFNIEKFKPLTNCGLGPGAPGSCLAGLMLIWAWDRPERSQTGFLYTPTRHEHPGAIGEAVESWNRFPRAQGLVVTNPTRHAARGTRTTWIRGTVELLLSNLFFPRAARRLLFILHCELGFICVMAVL